MNKQKSGSSCSCLSKYQMFALVIVSAILALTFAWGSLIILETNNIQCSPLWRVFQYRKVSDKEIYRGNDSKKQVIFTFDGGDGNQSTEQILATLAKHHIQGTFFLTGKFIEANPDLVKKIVSGGHLIFNHTYDHKHLTELSDSEVIAELQGMENALSKVTNRTTRPYFRAPYGDRDVRVRKIAAKAGYQSIYWTFDALDWEQKTGMDAMTVENRILNHVTPGSIYLMHLGDTITGSILDDVFTKIESKGYKIVSLTQGL